MFCQAVNPKSVLLGNEWAAASCAALPTTSAGQSVRHLAASAAVTCGRARRPIYCKCACVTLRTICSLLGSCDE